MRPGSESEDIHTIMSRFQTWAGKDPGNGNEPKLAPDSDSVREIPYEEAMRQFRERHKSQPRRVRATAEPAPLVQENPPVPASPSPQQPSVPVTASQPRKVALEAAPAKGDVEPLRLAQRFPAFATKASPTPQTSEKKKKRKTATKNASAQPPVIAQPSAPAAQKKSTPPRPPSRRPAPKKKASTARRATSPRDPEFKKVLAKTVRSEPSSAADRNRRITTRFSTAEERRLERAAAQAGLTVSAWLRQCALRAEAASAPPRPPASRSKANKQTAPSPSAASTLFSASAPSRSGWLTLLRQRFLSSHARFSERA